MGFFQNTRKPEGLGGKVMVAFMNMGHTPMATWGLSHIHPQAGDKVLDVGCGGGANIKRLLKTCRYVTGVDYSEVSVKKSQSMNEAAIRQGRCKVVQGDVQKLPFEDNAFDLVTAFETTYFWPDMDKSFGQIHRVLKSGGTFLVTNEITEENDTWSDKIEGMKVYSNVEMREFLRNAGFKEIQVDTQKDWVTFIAKK